MNSKQCNKCGQSKELHQFAKNKNCADGHLTTCKDCAKLYRQQNATQRKITDELRRRNNGIVPKTVFATDEERKHAHTQAVIKWQLKNSNTVTEYRAIWYNTNKDHILQKSRQWRQENAGRVNAWSAKRRAAISRATPTWANFEAIATVYEQSQEISNLTGIEHNVDHYYPINGKTVCGLHVQENLQVIAKQENLDKGDRHPDDFYQSA